MLKKSNWKPKYISNSSLIEIYNSQTRIFLKSILKPTKGVKKKKKFWDRESTLTTNLLYFKSLKIRSGNGWRRVKFNKYLVGYKAGEFTWNRKAWKKRLKRRQPKPKRR